MCILKKRAREIRLEACARFKCEPKDVDFTSCMRLALKEMVTDITTALPCQLGALVVQSFTTLRNLMLPWRI